MKRLLFLPLLALPLLVLSCDQKAPTEPQVAHFGTEPSPFTPQAGVNQLYAAQNHLGAINDRLAAVLGIEPEPFQPVVGQLNAMATELELINERIVAVLGFEPTPFRPDFYTAPALAVRELAQEIAGAEPVGWGSVPPGEVEELLFEALDAVGAAADAIVGATDAYYEIPA